MIESWPGISPLALVTLWGAYALVDGVFGIVLAARVGRSGERWGGCSSTGSWASALPRSRSFGRRSPLALLTLIALWAVVTGIAQIVAAVELRRLITGEWLLVLSGLLSIAFGVLTLIFSGAGALAIVGAIGINSIVFGVLLTALGFRMHRLGASSQHPMPTDGTATHA